jgi:uncharacterized protein
MMSDIIIEVSGKKIKGELNNSSTAIKVYAALPLNSSINRWGDEIYFEIPVESEIENGVEILDIGSLAYWPPGNAFCIFFGVTPASTDGKPRAAGPVNLIGNIKDKNDLIIFKSLSNSQSINISKK